MFQKMKRKKTPVITLLSQSPSVSENALQPPLTVFQPSISAGPLHSSASVYGACMAGSHPTWESSCSSPETSPRMGAWPSLESRLPEAVGGAQQRELPGVFFLPLIEDTNKRKKRRQCPPRSGKEREALAGMARLCALLLLRDSWLMAPRVAAVC